MLQRRTMLAGMAGLGAIGTAPALASHKPVTTTTTTTASATAAKSFEFYQTMRWNNGPASFDACGLKPMYIVYEGSLVTNLQPDYVKINKVVKEINAAKPALVTLDIECWNAVNAPDRTKLIDVITYIRARTPSTTKYGYYGILPKPVYKEYLAGGASLTKQQARNVAMKPLAKHVDWIMPMFHAFEASEANWLKFAEIIAKEARIYGKPVMPWLWMQYHEFTTPVGLRFQLLPGSLWKLQLETAYRLGDAACLWGTRVDLASGAKVRANWVANAPWWQETKKYLTARGKNLAACRV